ncbi:unnamed protein product [Protopolystoma xenopodis]|uniref:Uncharacterized protein n=1 Tax=Protopolystoma xenopodis TaxID=117903 RepID=A0A448XLD5_9PLAT|nr:unnamed protein product [Protopolystoma xenopodis]
MCVHKSQAWLRERILSDRGHEQQMQIAQLVKIANRMGCTSVQLAIGELIQDMRCVLKKYL